MDYLNKTGLTYIWNKIKTKLNLKANITDLDTLKTHKYHLDVTSTISANTNFTIPCYYKVGADVLDVRYLGENLRKTTSSIKGHYKEVGQVGSISNVIQLDGWSAGDLANIDEYFEFIIRGEYSGS